jgi:ABC-type lipoprotein export system ATPase subunit
MIKIENLCKSFQRPGEALLEVLHEVDFSVGKGEFVAIVGPSGSGKTTLMNILGLLDRPDTGDYELHGYPSELSGGQQQRVAIARAIVNDPAVVLADEPTGNLDQKSGRQIMNLFRELNRNGSTIVLITHDDAVANEASRVVRIDNGQLTEAITRVAS